MYRQYIHYTHQRGDNLNIIINNGSKDPIYEQIKNQIKQQIMDGSLKESDPLPSIRGLAKDLHISVITTTRAYEDLERDGFIETVVGKGSFVATQNHEFLKEQHLRQIEEQLLHAILLSKRAKISKEALCDLLTVLYEED